MNAGFEVWAIDLPVHGNSPGKLTNLPEMVQAIFHLAKNVETFHTMITHSFDSVIAINAIKEGVKTENLVTIGTPASAEFILSDFKKKINALYNLMYHFQKSVEQFIQTSF